FSCLYRKTALLSQKLDRFPWFSSPEGSSESSDPAAPPEFRSGYFQYFFFSSETESFILPFALLLLRI
ncbi:MAG TPA: hypothetical protein PLF46_02865, partial [Rectinema sp.]|nr:hypothetical protein [Rectinema sp.]